MLCVAAAGQDVRVAASVDSTTLTQLETLTLTITIDGSQRGMPLRLPKLEHFHVLSGPNTSVEHRFVNGRMSQSVSYGFRLRPRRAGKLQIPAFSIRIAGKTYTTEPITVNVVQGAEKRSLTLDEVAFVEWAPSKTEAYLHEQVMLWIRLYVLRGYSIQGGSLRLGEVDTGRPFLEEGLADRVQPRAKQEARDGLVYRVQEFPLRALFPVAAGEQRIPSTVMSGRLLAPRQRERRRAQARGHPFFDDDFFGGDPFGLLGGNFDVHELSMRAAPVTLTVKPLPEEGRPADFGDVVGTYDLAVSIAPQKVKLGDGITLTMVVAGQGSIKAVGEPKMESEEGFKVYRSEVTTESSIQGGAIGGRKVFKRIVEPQSVTITEVPAVTFTFFDPGKGEYVPLRRGPFPIRVESRQVETPLAVAPIAAGDGGKSNVVIQTEDILPIMMGYSRFPNQSQRLHREPWVWAAFAAAPLLLLVSLLVQRQRERLIADRGYARKVRASAAARQRLADARSALDSADAVDVYAVLSHALKAFIADKLDMPPASVSPLSVHEWLAGAGIDGDVISETRRALEACDDARFSPGSRGPDEVHADYEHIASLIRTLDRKL